MYKPKKYSAEDLEPLTRKPGTRVMNGSDSVDTTKGRICNKCLVYLERDRFYLHPKGFNGLGSICKGCTFRTPPSVRRIRYVATRDAGMCVRCDKTPQDTGVFCEPCWFSDKASSRANGDVVSIMRLWEEQNGRCFYTGVQLIPGVNASLDHQMPRSRGGSNDVANLRWVCLRVNIMKSSMTHEEFLAVCVAVKSRFAA